MNYTDGINYCRSKFGMKEDYIFNNKLQVFTVGGKQFCRVYTVNGQIGFALKAENDLNVVLRQMYTGIVLPDNMDNILWNIVILDSDVPDDEILYLIDLSYNIMFNGLTKNKQSELMKSPITKHD